MEHAQPLLLLVDVPHRTAAAVARDLGATAEIVESTADDVLAYAGGTPGQRRPTVVVLGEAVSVPVGVIHALRPHAADLVVAVPATPATQDELTVLPLLFSDDLVRRVHPDGAQPLADTVRELLEALTRRRAYAAARAAAQQQLSSGLSIHRQLGERLLGQFLNQAPIGALMLDGDAVIAWNRRAADVLELTEADSLRRPMTDLFPAEERVALAGHLLSASEQGRAVEPDAVFERTRADGTAQAVRVAAQQVLDLEGRGRTLVLTEDVTDRLHAQRKLAERTSHALLTAEVAAAMTAPGQLPERLRRCVRALTDRLGADRACIWTLSDQGELAHTTCSVADPVPGAVSACPQNERPLVEGVVATGRPYWNTAASPGPHTGQERGEGSFAGYPLISGEELLGVLSLTTRLALPASTLVTLANVADQIAVGTQQDRLLGRLRQTTRALERPLLPPHLPALPGFDLAARYAPYSEGLHIGGDFYDAFTAPDGRHILVLGDVCGKGPHAAAITGLVRHTLWAAAQHTSHPGHVLNLVNSALRRQNTPFCTLVYAVLDSSRTPARLQITCAGHPAPLLRRADGRTAPMDIRGPLLGVLPEPHHPVTELELLPGDTVLLYTDGFTEGAGAQDQRTPEDLADLVTSLTRAGAGTSAEGLVAALLDDAHRWWGERLRDDLAVLALAASPASPGTRPA